MKQDVSRRRFRARFTRDGTIVVPSGVAAGLKAGQPLAVEIAPAPRGGERDHDEREVAAIASMQVESPDLVRRCLDAQGALAAKTRPRRAGKR